MYNLRIVNDLYQRIVNDDNLNVNHIMRRYDLNEEEQVVVQDYITKLHNYVEEQKAGNPQEELHASSKGKYVAIGTLAGTLLGSVVGFMSNSTLEGALYGAIETFVAGFFVEEFYNPIGSHFGVPKGGDINGTSPYLHDLKDEVRNKIFLG